MTKQPRPQIIETAAHAKGVDALPVEKQDALMDAFEIGHIPDTQMTRIEKLGFVASRMHELTEEGAIEALSRSQPDVFEAISAVVGIEPAADEHWLERIQRIHQVESRVTTMGF